MHRNTLAVAAALAAALAAAPAARAQKTPEPARQRPAAVRYDVAFPDAVHHQVRITVTFPGLTPGGTLAALMPRSSPGRYALHEFAKNVYDLSAVDGRGRPLQVTRVSTSEWDVKADDGTVAISYTVFGDHADGTYAGIDSTHAHFNMPAAFMFARGLERRPIRITFHPIHGWKIATQLVRTADPNTFEAPDLQYFMDSPTELSDYTLSEWHEGPAGKLLFRMALHHEGTDSQATQYAAMAKRVVEEEAAVWGTFPQYDFGSYTFIIDYLPWVFGDGMEHRNSTLITGSRPLAPDAVRNLGTVAHEYFHSWNMERLRSKGIEPFDFERANMSSGLWFGEGFTNYYGHLVLARAGFVPLADFARGEGYAINAVVNSPARRFRSPVQMSQEAPFTDAAVSIDLVDRPNTFISYYTWGEVVALGLDLTLREKYRTTLDDYMRAMWRSYGQYQENETPQRPYTVDDLERVLGQVTKDPAFAKSFFTHYVRGHDVVDYAALLAPAGLLLRKANAGRPWLGLESRGVAFRDSAAVLLAPVLIGTPLYQAGIAEGDRIMEIDGQRTGSAEEIAAALSGHQPGDTVLVRFWQRGEVKRAPLVLGEAPALELVTYESAGMPVTDAMRALREAWLGSARHGG